MVLLVRHRQGLRRASGLAAATHPDCYPGLNRAFHEPAGIARAAAGREAKRLARPFRRERQDRQQTRRTSETYHEQEVETPFG